MESLFIGTSAFTAAGWEGSFYPQGTKSADYLLYYAGHGPASVEMFQELWRKQLSAESGKLKRATGQGQLFK
jgi:hypothetical protein